MNQLMVSSVSVLTVTVFLRTLILFSCSSIPTSIFADTSNRSVCVPDLRGVTIQDHSVVPMTICVSFLCCRLILNVSSFPVSWTTMYVLTGMVVVAGCPLPARLSIRVAWGLSEIRTSMVSGCPTCMRVGMLSKMGPGVSAASAV